MKNAKKSLNKIDSILGDKEKVKDIIFGLKVLVSQNKQSQKEFGKLIDGISKISDTNEQLKQLNDVFSEFKASSEALKQTEFKAVVSNIPEIQKVKIVNQPKVKDVQKVTLNQPSWYKPFEVKSLIDSIGKAIKSILSVKVVNNGVNEAIPVRLSDGRQFYKAISNAIASGSISAFQENGVAKEGELVNGRVQVDINSISESIGYSTEVKQDRVIEVITGNEQQTKIIDSGGSVVNPASADYQVENVAQLYTVIDNQTNASQKTQIVDSGGNVWNMEVNGGMPVNVQDQYTDPVDFYFTSPIATTTLSADMVVDATYIDVTDSTGASAGKAITIKGTNSRVMQATILSVVGNRININVPNDKSYSTGSSVEFGNWNMNVNGFSSIVTYSIAPPAGIKWDITRVIFSISDDSAMDDGKFGGISSLSKGVVFRKTNGVKKNIFVVNDNGGFTERSFDVLYSSKAPAGTYGFVAQKELAGSENYGVAVRLDGDSNDSLDIIIQDNLTGLVKFAAVAQGHIVQ